MHPAIERIMKKEICQHRTNDSSLRGASLPVNQVPIRHAHRCLQPPLQIEQHPWAFRVSPHGSHQKFPVNLIEETLDVEVEYPVRSPTTPPGFGEGIMRGLPGPISIGVPVEHRFQDRFQMPLDHHLGDPVGNRWNPERPGSSSIAFRYVNATHGWGKVASRRHSVPDPIEVLTQIPVEILDRLPVHSSRPSVGLHLLVRFPHFAFGNTKRPRFNHGGHPLSGCHRDKAE